MLKTKRLYPVWVLVVALLFAVVIANAQDERPFIGIMFAPDGMSGLLVQEVVADSPAADAGLQVNDVIVSLDDALLTAGNTPDVLSAYTVGDTVALTVLRGEDTVSLELTLGAMPDDMPAPNEDTPADMPPRPRLGVAVDNTADGNGALVMNVLDDSPADVAGILRDDVITAVNGEPVDSATSFVDAVNTYAPDDTITLTLQRGDETLDLEATLELAPPPPPMNDDAPRELGRPDRGNRMQPFMFEPDTVQFNDDGWTITEAAEDSVLYEMGLRTDDRIAALNGESFETREDVFDIMHGGEFGSMVDVTVERDGESVELELPAPFVAALLVASTD